MKINNINGSNTQTGQMGMNQAADSYSRNIQNQIANAQKQLQELSSDEDMALEEKMKKRQEIQKQINDLNIQLRQHQAELRREKRQAKSSSVDDMFGGGGNAGSKSAGLSQASMTAMISADTSIKQAKAQGGVATKMEGRARVLKAEIKTDGARGAGTQNKQEELAETEQKVREAESAQLSALADANKTLEEAAKADSKEEKKDGKEEKNSGTNRQGETASASESANAKSGVSDSKDEKTETKAPQQEARVSVDIRL